jgi:hypothetical protein
VDESRRFLWLMLAILVFLFLLLMPALTNLLDYKMNEFPRPTNKPREQTWPWELFHSFYLQEMLVSEKISLKKRKKSSVAETISWSNKKSIFYQHFLYNHNFTIKKKT